MKLESASSGLANFSPASMPVGDFGDLVGESEAFRNTKRRLEQVAPTNATVLLLGETGTGKSVAAHMVHRLSARRRARFTAVDCTSLPATLIESELFGRERGAFTDAHSTQIGRFELANGGTVFLDEVGELPADAQSKLLRVLQTGEFERLGSPRTIRSDVRVIAATNRHLIDEVKSGRFRRDLFYRLNVFPIVMPSLRERRSDIPILAHHLLQALCRKHERQIDAIPPMVLDALLRYDWPGNIRELENVLERAIITTAGSTLSLVEPLGSEMLDALPVPRTLVLLDVERAHILWVLNSSGWKIEGARGAAAALGLKPSTLRSRLRKLGVTRNADVPAVDVA
jgi:formate hydrogenlyase transcriptional activator